MKREIKFRAWLPEVKGWLAEGFSIAMDGTEWYDDNGYSYRIKDDFILMQFTGLKDKNGKEIYEGDVYDIYESKKANSTNAGQLLYENCEVVFHAGCFCFMIPVFPNGRSALPIYMEESRDFIYKGNIYENPELLK